VLVGVVAVVILFALPLAVIGAFVALAVTGHTTNIIHAALRPQVAQSHHGHNQHAVVDGADRAMQARRSDNPQM
jgi:Cu/Ag efflux pump CusA